MEKVAAPSRVRRPYDASRRQADARARQQRVVEEATRLFLEQGYGTTSIEQIASAADVSVQFVYAAFESKAGVLSRAVDVAVSGDAEVTPVGQQPESVALRAEPDVVRKLRGMAGHASRVHARSANLVHLVDSVAGSDPAIAALRDSLDIRMRRTAATFAASFPPEMLRASRRNAADVFCHIGGPRSYHWFVEECGWSSERYERWLADTFASVILRDGALQS